MCRVCNYYVCQYSSDTITNSINNSNMLNFTKDKIKLQIIIFCVKHNREQTITLEFEIPWGRGMGVGAVYYIQIN